ncbi:MAG: radical SAM protein [Proteobacteria bacterium]|nr:radical SAM protein [Pseudomonadota bacterium]
MSKILLLNPPGTRPYLRDYYCSKIAKADYLYEPTDLLILSGLLNEDHQVQVLDCIATGMQTAKALEWIRNAGPDAVIFLSGAVSWHEDRKFLKEVKQLCPVPLIGSGDLFLEDGDKILMSHDFVDAVLLDFTSHDLLHYLKHGAKARPDNMICRQGERIVNGSLKRATKDTFEIPLPRHDLFPHHRYRYPTVKRPPFATVLTDYGCPYHCRFCVMGKIGYKVRHVNNVLDELKMLADMGFREIYFNDQTFGALRERAIAMCKGMIERQFHFGWQAWSRVDLMDEELLRTMQAAGCHSMFFGVESANEKTLKAQKKGFSLEQIRRTFFLCRRLGIRTMATFIIGLPGETEADIRRTMRFALELDPDYASFNLLVPRAATDIRKEALGKEWFKAEQNILDQSGTYPIMGNEYLGAARIWQLKNEAFRSFYFRPAYWLRRLKQINTLYELRHNLANGWTLLSNMVMNRADRLKNRVLGKVWS